jgi:hypothetical protein
VTRDTASQTEAARRLFLWVRDEIRFSVGGWQRTASQTLAARSGTCTNKANLFVALARAVGIPAGFYVLHVQGQEYLGPIVPARLRRRINRRSLHAYPAVCIDGRWIRCDPTDDRTFAESTVHLNPQSRLVEWDGAHDALLQLDPAHIIDARGPLRHIDEELQKKQRLRGTIVRVGNRYVEFLRAYAHAYSTQDALEQAFARWLLWRHPLSWLIYCGLALRRRQ